MSDDHLEQRLARLDALHEKLQPDSTGASPHPPAPPWLEEVQKRNPYYNEIILSEKV